MRVSTLNTMKPGEIEIGVVYASVEGVHGESYDECIHELKEKAEKMGAVALIGIHIAQSQFQWNQRTSLIATAIGRAPE